MERFEGKSPSPWLAMWTKPRATIGHILDTNQRKLEALESGTHYGDVKTVKANWRRRLKVMEEQRANLVRKQKSN